MSTPKSPFQDASARPDASRLKAVLGKTFDLWNDLIHRIGRAHPPMEEVWNYSKGFGWALRLKRGDRIILYMLPGEGHFMTSFVLGEKAVTSAHEHKLPVPVLAAIDAAPKYTEGRGVRFETRTATDVKNMEKLAAIKMA